MCFTVFTKRHQIKQVRAAVDFARLTDIHTGSVVQCVLKLNICDNLTKHAVIIPNFRRRGGA